MRGAIWYQFVQFKNCEKHPRRSVTFSKVADFNLQLHYMQHSSMGLFHVFKNVQMVPNRATHHNCKQAFLKRMNILILL